MQHIPMQAQSIDNLLTQCLYYYIIYKILLEKTNMEITRHCSNNGVESFQSFPFQTSKGVLNIKIRISSFLTAIYYQNVIDGVQTKALQDKSPPGQKPPGQKPPGHKPSYNTEN